jgi:DnaK suppressor protein
VHARNLTRLAAERDELAARLRDGRSPGSPPESHVQPAESPLDDIARDLEFHSREATTARLALVEAALERLRDGAYGLCGECGERIAPKRLTHDPAAALCVACQAATETPTRTPSL